MKQPKAASQAEIARCIDAVRRSGLAVGEVHIEGKCIRIVIATDDARKIAQGRRGVDAPLDYELDGCPIERAEKRRENEVKRSAV